MEAEFDLWPMASPVVDDGESLDAILEMLGEPDNGCSLLDEMVWEKQDDAWLVETVPHEFLPLGKLEPRDRVLLETKRKKPRQKISGSTRVRNELFVLRAEAQELEQQLELMRARRAIKRIDAEEESPHECDMYRHQKITMWRGVAQRQHRVRREAEAMNERLRASVDEQRKMSQQFLRSLNRGSTMLQSEQGETLTLKCSALSAIASHTKSVRDNDVLVNSALSEKLLHRVHSMATQVTEAFSSHIFQSNEPISRYAEHASDGSVSVLDSRTVPFDLGETSDAIWKYYAARANLFDTKNGMDVNLLVKGFRMTLGSASHIGNVQGTIAGRRIVEQDRVVIVWATDIAPARDAIGSGYVFSHIAEYLAFQSHGWTVLSPTAEGTTKIQMRHNIASKSTQSSAMSGGLDQMVLKLLVQGLGEHQEAIHRRLGDVFSVGRHPETASDGYATPAASSTFSALGSLLARATGMTLETW